MRTAAAMPAVALLTGLLLASTVLTSTVLTSTVLASPALGQATGTTTSTATTTTAPTAAGSTTVTSPTSTSTTSTSTNSGPAATGESTTTTTTTLPQIGQGPLPGSPPSSTTVPAPAVTIPAAEVQALLKGLQGDLAQFTAIDAYRRDQLVTTNAATQKAAADAAVSQAEHALAAANAARDAAVQNVGTNVRNLSGLAIALYLHEDVATQTLPDSYNGSIEDRQVMLTILLEGGQHKVKASRQDVSVAADAVRDASARLVQARGGQTAARQAQDQAAAALAVDRTGALGRAARSAGGPSSPAIAGPPALTAEELAGWFEATGHQADVTVPMSELASDYVDAGHSEGVTSDVAFAQSVIETGYFGFPAGGQLVATDNNFAGIGACDTCSHGWSFPDARTGVAAQLQLLHAYASPTPVATPLIGKVFVAGCCRTWMSLTGVWATAPTYGYVVLSLYKQMIDWALPRRLASAGLGTAP